MTNVRCLIKYSPDTIEVTSRLKDRIEVWRKATDGSGRFKALLLGSWVNQFDPDDPIQIRFDDIIVFEGYIDRGLPLAEGNVYNQFYALVGRDYGQDLLNKQVNKTGTLGVYTVQYADLIIDDMLYEANSEIIFTPSTDHKYGTVDTIPQIPYTDKGDEFLIEAFRKIFEQIDYDFYVDENKTLHIFPIGSVDSGIVLKCVAGASDNNLLNLQKTEFDSYDIKNYIVARANKIDDGWTEFNYEDYTCAVGNTLSNGTDFVNKGLASIKCALGTGADCRIILSFPKFNYDYLPFDLLGEDVLKIAYRMTGMTGANGKFLIMLEDDAGNKIVWREDLKEKDLWHLLSVPMGKDVTKNIIGYNDLISTWHTEKTNCWHYESGYSTFSWKIKKITFMNYGTSYYIPTTLWIDGLSLPFIMVSYKQNAESQGLYKVRHYTIQAKNVRTQKELDTLATSELAKLMSPLYSLRVTALGSAGIIGGAFKWIPGYMVTVNSPEDGISNQQYRISEAHYVVSEVGQSGHDFIVEADLVPKQLSISGSRLSGVQDPKVALLRGLSDRIAALEGIESIYTDYLPPLPRDAAEKINVGDFGNLSDTAVAFTRQWEAEDAEADAIWAVVDDAAAHGGKARAATGLGNGEKIKILDGPLGNVGEFYAIMRVKTNFLDAWKTVELRITNKDSPYDVLNSIEIKGSNFPTTNKYHAFAMRVEIPQDKQNLEIAVLYWGSPDRTVHCDYVALVPADVPLGYADVTINSETQNTSAQDATQNSSANDATQNSTANDATQNSSANDATQNTSAVASTGSVVSTGAGTNVGEVDIGTGWTDIFNFTAPNVDEELYLVTIELDHFRATTTATDGVIDVRLTIDGVNYPYANGIRKWVYLSTTSATIPITYFFTIPKNIKNVIIYVQAKATVASKSLYQYDSWGHKPHTHALVNPSHATGMNNPAHSTGMTNPPHSTGVNNPVHATGITNPSHAHGVTDPSHEH